MSGHAAGGAGPLRRTAMRATVLTASVVAGLLLLEGGVRWLLPQPLPHYEPGIWLPDDNGLGHRLAANVDTTMNTGERDVRFRTDALGHRIGESGPSDRAGALRILTLGDSFLEAMAVSFEESVAGRLEARLGARLGAPVVVVNTGVSGTTPNRYRLVAERELERRPADAVITFLFMGNDVIGNRLERLPVRPPEIRKEFRWPRNLTPREWVGAWVHPLYTHLRERSHLTVLLKATLLDVLVRFGLTEHAFPTVYLRSEASSARWDNTAGLCAEIAEAAERAGGTALVVLLPPDYVVDLHLGRAFVRGAGLDASAFDFEQPSRLLGARMRDRGLAVLDATPGLREASARGLMLYGRVDRHLSPEGHEVLARLLEDALADQLDLPPEPGHRNGDKT